MRLQLPKEHGSWGMFFIPLVLGLLAGGRLNLEAALFVIAATATFLAREPFFAWWRSRRRGLDASPALPSLLIFGTAALAPGVPLLILRPWLGAMSAASVLVVVWHAEQAMKGRGRSTAAELLAIAVSTLAAPGAFYSATGRLDSIAVAVWAAAAAYFGSSVFYVKMRVTAAHAKVAQSAARARRDCAVYHVLLMAAAGALATSSTGSIEARWMAAGFVPVILRAFAAVARPTRELNLKRIGWTEVVYSIIFLACATLAL